MQLWPLSACKIFSTPLSDGFTKVRRRSYSIEGKEHGIKMQQIKTNFSQTEPGKSKQCSLIKVLEGEEC